MAVEDAYMDDVITGSHCVEEAAKLQDEIIGLYARGGFQLQKFMSNSLALLKRNEPKLRAIPEDNLFDADPAYKTLGISLDYDKDQFYFQTRSQNLIYPRPNGPYQVRWLNYLIL